MIKSFELIITIIPRIDANINIGYSIFKMLIEKTYFFEIPNTKIPNIKVSTSIKVDK